MAGARASSTADYTCETELVCFLPGFGGGAVVDEPESEMVSGSAGAGITTRAAAVFLLIISPGSRRWLLAKPKAPLRMRAVAAVVWCGVVWCGTPGTYARDATREDDAHWTDSAGCVPRGACFRRRERWALSKSACNASTKSASKARSVAEAVSNGMHIVFSYGVSWRCTLSPLSEMNC